MAHDDAVTKPTMDRRSFRPRPAGAALSAITSPTFRRRGFARREILTQWPAIVGDLMARYTCPERLQFGQDRSAGATLVVRASSGFATELQHLHPIVLDRINTFFGYRAVERLTIVQAPLPTPTAVERKVLRQLSESEERAVAARVAGTRNDDLAGALRALGRTLTATR